MKLKTLLAILPIIAWATPQDVEPFAFKRTNDKNAYCFVTQNDSGELTPFHDKALSLKQIKKVYFDQKSDTFTQETAVMGNAIFGFGVLMSIVSLSSPKGSNINSNINSITKYVEIMGVGAATLLILPELHGMLSRRYELNKILNSSQTISNLIEEESKNKFMSARVINDIQSGLQSMSEALKKTTPDTDIDCQ